MIVKKFAKKHKTIYLIEEEKAFTDDDIRYLYNISRNIFIYQLYMDKTNAIASNQIFTCDILSYMLILDKLDFYEKICNKYCKTDLDKALFTIVELANYIKFDASNTKETSCLTNAFLLKHGVCIDFSIAFWKCMERLNINCLIVKGIGNENYVENDMILFDHAWNQVEIDSKWYNLDITWFNSMRETTYLLTNDEVFYEDGRHKTRFEVNKCNNFIDNNEIIKKIDVIKKYKNIFEEFDNNNKEIKLNKKYKEG